MDDIALALPVALQQLAIRFEPGWDEPKPRVIASDRVLFSLGKPVAETLVEMKDQASAIERTLSSSSTMMMAYFLPTAFWRRVSRFSIFAPPPSCRSDGDGSASSPAT